MLSIDRDSSSVARHKLMTAAEANRAANVLLTGASLVELRVTPGTYTLVLNSRAIIPEWTVEVQLFLRNALFALVGAVDLDFVVEDAVSSRAAIMAFIAKQFAIDIDSVEVDVNGRLTVGFGGASLSAPLSAEDFLGDELVWGIECERNPALPHYFVSELLCVPVSPSVEFYGG